MRSARGFTIVEFLVVMAVIGILISIGFNAMGPADDGERLRNAQKELVSRLTGLQNKAYSGDTLSNKTNTKSTHIATFSAISNSATTYKVDGEDIYLPKNIGIVILSPDSSVLPLSADSVSLYFYHPAKTNYSDYCPGFACYTRNPPNLYTTYSAVTDPIVLKFFLTSGSTLTKCVTIEGANNMVSRIYENTCP